MSKSRPVPQPGELITMNFDPQAGHEQGGRRPALVISEASYNARSSLTLVCPITSQVKGYPFEVPLPEDCKLKGVVLADQVRSLDLKAREWKCVETAPEDLLNTVRAYIALLIGAK